MVTSTECAQDQLQDICFIPPDWSADFLIWLGGKRIGREGEIETLSGADLQEIEDRLHPHQNEDTDFARLLRWKLLPPSPALTSGR